MKINLNEIPSDGKTWSISSKKEELSNILKDLIGENSYQASFTITPLPTSGAYELRGHIKTQTPEQCSRCGIDFNFKLDHKFNYILMPEIDYPRDGKYSKPNHYTDLHEETTETAEYQGHHFEVGEFFHELVAINEPAIPAPAADENEDCTVCKISLKNRSFGYDEGEMPKSNTFGALKGIKLN